MAVLGLTATYDSIEATVSGVLVSDAERKTVTWYIDNKYDGYDYIAFDGTASNTFSGLNEGTTYTITAIIQGQSGNEETLKKDITTLSSKIELWSWTSSNGSATAEQTKKAYTAVTTKGYVSAFSYLVWNDLVSKLNEYIVKYQESKWNGDILSLSATKMTESDKTLTAKRFNSLRAEMNYWFNTGYPMVSIGDEVKGSYFTEIVETLNIEIDFANSQ